MTRILIADDHPVLRNGLKELLVSEFEVAKYGEAQDAREVMALIQSQAWDLVMLDITMPGRSGIDVLTDLKRLRPGLPVLVLSVHPEDQYGRRVLKAGAAGYMNKEVAPAELVNAVRKVLAGGRYVSAALAEKLASDLTSEALPHERLSDREFEVFLMIASGKRSSRIAQDLHLSTSTVGTYRARTLEKMGLSANAELIHYALRNRLID